MTVDEIAPAMTVCPRCAFVLFPSRSSQITRLPQRRIVTDAPRIGAEPEVNKEGRPAPGRKICTPLLGEEYALRWGGRQPSEHVDNLGA